MNRLTGRNENGDAIINMDGVNSEFEARQRIREYSGKIIKKLCEYEEICDNPSELRARLEKAVELPAIVMIERTIVDGKFKPTQKAQAFNGRIGVVYRDETKWKGLLVDICSEKTSDYEPAKARIAELKGDNNGRN